MEKLREQLAALLITRQVIGNIRESCIPFVLEQLKLAKMSFETVGSPVDEVKKDRREIDSGDHSDDSSKMQNEENEKLLLEENEKKEMDLGKRILDQAEVESSLYKYDGTFEDYLEMFIQFGYVILFSSAFPMAAVWALLNNIIEIRSDAFKLCCIFQRPFGQRAENIGSWHDAMEIMCIIGVAVNCALIGLSGQVQRMFPELSTTGTIILIVVLEHALLSLKYIISCAIPDTPEWVATEMAKIEFNRREASKKLLRTHSGSNFILNPLSASLMRHKEKRSAFSNTVDAACQADITLASESEFDEFQPLEIKTEDIKELSKSPEKVKYLHKELFPKLNLESSCDDVNKETSLPNALETEEQDGKALEKGDINEPTKTSTTAEASQDISEQAELSCISESPDNILEDTASTQKDEQLEVPSVSSKFMKLSAATSKLKGFRRFSLGSSSSKNTKKLPFSFLLPGVTKSFNRLSSPGTANSKKDSQQKGPTETEKELLNTSYTDS